MVYRQTKTYLKQQLYIQIPQKTLKTFFYQEQIIEII